jgi:hypothetical protein
MPNLTAPAVAAAVSTPTTVAASVTGPTYVMGVWYRPVSTMTGQATNNRVLRLRNTTTPTDIASLALNAGVVLPGGVWTRIPLLVSPTVAAAIATQALAWESNAVGTGIADPGGTVRIRWTREQSLAQRTVTDPQGRSIVTPPELALDVDAPPEPGEYP